MAFSNYFILHKNNYRYYESVMSVLPEKIDHILWNDYFLDRRNTEDKSSNWMRVLMQYDAFKWGLITAMLARRDPLSERVHLGKPAFLGYGLLGVMRGFAGRLGGRPSAR